MTLTAEMMADLRVPVDIRISPGGEQAVLSLSTNARPEEHPRAALWMVYADGTPARQITAGIANDTSPSWSPDGSLIAFLSDREKRGKSQVWILPVDGGEAQPVTDEAGGVSSFTWLVGDISRLAYVTPDVEDEDEKKRREREKDDAVVYGAFWPYGRLKLLNREDGGTRDVDLGERHAQSLAASPDGQRIAVVTSDLPTLESRTTTGALSLVDIATGQVQEIAALGRACTDVVWSRDGSRLYYIASAGDVPAVSSAQIWAVEAAPDSTPRLITGDLPACIRSLARGRDDERIYAVVLEGVDSAIYALHPEGDTFEKVTHFTGDLGYLSISDDGGTYVTLGSSVTRPYDAYTGSPDGDLQRRSDFNPELNDVSFGPQEAITWEREGFTLDGILIWPEGKSAGDGPLPTAVSLHGGPYGRWANAFGYARPFAHWLAAQGYLVFMPNPRGGAGHGEKFARAVLHSVGDQDWLDILAGIDLIVERGYADPDRMGVGGWSQGGFMTAWAIGHDPEEGPRFKCAIMGAGVSDWGMMVATSDLPTFEQELGGGNPYEGPGPHEFDRWSPISYVHRAKTPTLILHGQNDERVPVSQATFMHRGLMRYGVETELVTYPREPHGLQERQHVIDLHRRVAAWYKRWLS